MLSLLSSASLAAPYLLLLVVSFGAATLLPLSSEVLLFSQIRMDAGTIEGLLPATFNDQLVAAWQQLVC